MNWTIGPAGRAISIAGFGLLVSALNVSAQQSIPATGRVVRVEGSDTLPVSGVRLVLHRVGRSLQGPVDSTVTDRAGRFRLRFVPDTTVLFLLSARHAGIEYFSPPINTNPGLPDTALVVVVSDTSSSVPVILEARYLVIRSASEDGSRPVLDLLVLENHGSLTRVAPDSVRPSWAGSLPRGVLGVRVGDADLSADAIVVRNDSVLVFAPIAPGEKQIALEYVLPAGGAAALTFGQDSVATNVLVQELSAKLEGGGMVAVDSQVIEGTSFHRWVGAPNRGDVLRISFGGSSGRVPRWVLPVLVGLMGAGLMIAALRLLPARAAGTQSFGALTDRIAQLEARYAGRESEVQPDEWQAYLRDRERLRADLTSHLAARGPTA